MLLRTSLVLLAGLSLAGCVGQIGDADVVVLAVLAPDDECGYSADLERVVFRPSLAGRTYVAHLLVASERQVTFTGADITVLDGYLGRPVEVIDASGNPLLLQEISTRAGGTVQPGADGRPGEGVIRVDVIPEELGEALLTPCVEDRACNPHYPYPDEYLDEYLDDYLELIPISLTLRGRAGGQDVRSEPFVMLIERGARGSSCTPEQF